MCKSKLGHKLNVFLEKIRNNEQKDHVFELTCNQAFVLSSPAFSGTQTLSMVNIVFFFARLTNPPSQATG